MRILNEKEKKVVDMECEFEDDEMNILRKYAADNMSIQEHDEMIINWALVDILKKQIEGMQND